MSEEIKQGTDAWKLARCGSLGASRIADAVARIKTGYGASRANLMAELIAERLTGVPYETYQSAAMLHGHRDGAAGARGIRVSQQHGDCRGRHHQAPDHSRRTR